MRFVDEKRSFFGHYKRFGDDMKGFGDEGFSHDRKKIGCDYQGSIQKLKGYLGLLCIRWHHCKPIKYLGQTEEVGGWRQGNRDGRGEEDAGQNGREGESGREEEGEDQKEEEG